MTWHAPPVALKPSGLALPNGSDSLCPSPCGAGGSRNARKDSNSRAEPIMEIFLCEPCINVGKGQAPEIWLDKPAFGTATDKRSAATARADRSSPINGDTRHRQLGRLWKTRPSQQQWPCDHRYCCCDEPQAARDLRNTSSTPLKNRPNRRSFSLNWMEWLLSMR